MKGYLKTAFAILGALLVTLQAVLNPDGPGGQAIMADEWIVMANAVLTAILVYIVPNLVGGVGEFAKSLLAGGFAVTSILASVLIGGLQPAEWITIVVTFGVAAGVFLAPAPKHPL